MSTPRGRRARVANQGAPAKAALPTGSPAQLTVTATEAQNEFGRVLDSAAQDRVVIITRHNTPRAVLLSIDRYNALVSAGEAVLDTLTGEFDALLERMQSAETRAGMRRAFDASPRELGEAAVAAARATAVTSGPRRGRGRRAGARKG